MKNAVLTLLLLMSLGAAGPARADINPKDVESAKPTTPAVQLSSVKGWKSLGNRWAAALNSQGEMIAIYDLSYPDLLSRFPFAVIGGRSVRKADIVKNIYDSKFAPNVDKKMIEDAIAELQKTQSGPIVDGSLPANWWKNVPWKSARALSNEEPASFSLSEINIRTGLKTKELKKFNEAIAGVESALNELEGSGIGDHFMDRFLFQRMSEGTYQVHYVTGARAVSQPRKIADLASTKVEFYNTAKLELAKQILDQAVGLIPGEIVKGVVETVVSRFFHFHKLVLSGHQNMAVEMLNSIQDGASNVSMTTQEQAKAIEALSFAQSSLLTSFKWIWKKPTDEWNKVVKKNENQAQQGMDWIAQHNLKSSALNKRFAYSFDPATQITKLLNLAKDKPNSKNGPLAAIDFSKPDAQYKYRMFVEVMSAAVVFGTKFIPIPYAGSLIKKAYMQFIEKPVDDAKIWESRMAVHLESRMQEDHSTDLKILDQQRVNPLFQSRENMNALVAARKQMIGLP